MDDVAWLGGAGEAIKLEKMERSNIGAKTGFEKK
jgi:hypothetical protein